MNHGENAGHDWVADLAEFLRAEPGVTAVRVDPAAHRWSVATLGAVPVPGLEGNSPPRSRPWRRGNPRGRPWWRRPGFRCGGMAAP
jgi:hypothetical protein